MKRETPIGKIPTASLRRPWLFFFLIFGVSVSQARTPKDLFQNGDLTNGSNYSPAGTPTSANDLLLSTAATVLTLNGATLDLGSLNQTNNLAYTVSNNAPGTANSTLTLGNG